MNTKISQILLATLILAAAGCASFKETDRATGALDAAMILTGVAKPDVAVIETATDGGGVIAGARAVADHGGVLIYGTVQKQSAFDAVSTASSYVAITVLNSSGKAVAEFKIDYFPHEIPRTTSRSIGFSHYSLRLPEAPVKGSKIIVAFRAIRKQPNGASHPS